MAVLNMIRNIFVPLWPHPGPTPLPEWFGVSQYGVVAGFIKIAGQLLSFPTLIPRLRCRSTCQHSRRGP